VWPEDAENTSRVANGELQVGLTREPRGWGDWIAFQEGSSNRVVLEALGTKPLEAGIDDQAVEITPFPVPPMIER